MTQPPLAAARRVAALYDVHGNLPALEAVLAEVAVAGVDRVVVGGDVFPGPLAVEALGLLLALEPPVDFLRGNGDRLVVGARRGESLEEVPAAHQGPLRWHADRLDEETAAAIAAWPAGLRLEVAGLGEVAFCHATPGSDTEIVTRATPEAELFARFAAARAPLVVCGHTHVQFDRRAGDRRVVNAGSVGMPFDTPGAYWLLLGPGVELRRTDYDLVGAAARVRATAYPGADGFAAGSILSPPSAVEMTELLERTRTSVGALPQPRSEVDALEVPDAEA